MTQPSLPDPLPQATASTVLPDGQAIPRNTPPPAGGTGFRVDLERAPQAIRELEDALDQLQDLRRDALRLGRVVPPTSDPVSRDAAEVISAAAVGGPGSLLVALEAGIDQITNLVNALRHDLQRYQTGDTSSAAAFRAP